MTLKEYLTKQLDWTEHCLIMEENQNMLNYDRLRSLEAERKMLNGFIRDIESGEVKVTSAGEVV